MRKLVLALLFVLCIPLGLSAQDVVRMGGYRFVPDANVGVRTRGGEKELPPAVNGAHNVMVQLRELPTADEVARLAKKGVELQGYINGKAYFATVRQGVNPLSALRGTSVRSLLAVRPEWKVDPSLVGANIPSYAQEGRNYLKVVVHLASNIGDAAAMAKLKSLGASAKQGAGIANGFELRIPKSALKEVAALPWVLSVTPGYVPTELYNRKGSQLVRSALLRVPAELQGRGLTGKGVRVGIWDGNSVNHPDFAGRVYQQEYEMPDEHDTEHGTHVTGTILGAGLLNPDGAGMAPGATAYTYNFNVQSNQLFPWEEMAIAQRSFGITLTQNSYGPQLFCAHLVMISYNSNDQAMDQLALMAPYMSHIFAAGNAGELCIKESTAKWGAAQYGSSTSFGKNAIFVGALNDQGTLATFSSAGPLDDGRIFPTICAKGVQTFSVGLGDTYKFMDGTSMACPAVTGTLALLTERYKQLYGGDVRSDLLRGIVANSADDAGRPGPDFLYGYGNLNAEQAATTMENKWFALPKKGITNGETQKYKITVPPGAKRARVMLVWNDAVSHMLPGVGVPALVNDLDLTVDGKLPLVLTPKMGHVKDVAAPGVDRLNNIEQVIIDKPTGTLSVEVKGTSVPKLNMEGAWDYALVWFFEMEQLQVASPANGEKFTPGERFFLRFDGLGYEHTYQVELSYNGGKDWIKLGGQAAKHLKEDIKPRLFNPFYDIPRNAPLTTQAKVRVITQDGRVAESPMPFTIAPQIQNVDLDGKTCGVNTWNLTWTPEPHAEKGYVILYYNKATQQFEKFKELPVTASSLALTMDDLSKSTIWTVAAKIDDTHYGKRAVAAETYRIPEIKPSEDQFPIVETFRTFPCQYFRPEYGDDIRLTTKPTLLKGATPGSNILGFTITPSPTRKDPFETKSFDTDDLFAARNESVIGKLMQCNVDFSKIDGEVLMKIIMAVVPRSAGAIQKQEFMPEFRVMAGGQILPTNKGENKIIGDGSDLELYYKLTPHFKGPISLEFAGVTPGDKFVFNRVEFMRPAKTQDVQVALLDTPLPGRLTTDELVRILVRNNSNTDYKQLSLKVKIDGKEEQGFVLKDVKGFEQRELNLLFDFSTNDSRGKKFDFEVSCEVLGDVNPADNTARAYVINTGQVLAMPMSLRGLALNGSQVGTDPKVTYKLKSDEKLIFADHGGVVSDYLPGQLSTLKILPSMKGKRVKVRFKSFKTNRKSGALAVFLGDIPTDLYLKDAYPSEPTLAGEINTANGELEYLSGAEDGGITFMFQSLGMVDEGWEADVTEIAETPDPLSIVAMNARAQGNDPFKVISPVVTVRNASATPVENARLMLRRGGEGFAPDRQDVQLASNASSNFTFSEAVELPMSTTQMLHTWVECSKDGNADNNEVYDVAAYDCYAVPAPSKSTAKMRLLEVGCQFSNFKIPSVHDAPVGQYPRGALKRLMATAQAIEYRLRDTLYYYAALPTHGITIKYLNETYANGSAVVWVDWNNNKTFEDSERTVEQLGAGKGEVIMTPRDPGASVAEGIYRARVAVVPEGKEGNPAFPQSIEHGQIRDFSMKFDKGYPPSSFDIAILNVLMGDYILEKPVKNQRVEAHLRNVGPIPVNGQLRVVATINDKPLCDKVVTISMIPGYDQKVDLGTIDMEEKGVYRVDVKIYEQPKVINEENNHRYGEVILVNPNPPSSSGNDNYAIAFTTDTDPDGNRLGEPILFPPNVQVGPTYGRHLPGTFEMWFFLNESRHNVLLSSDGDGLTVMTLYHMTNGLPDNALAIQCGQTCLYYTDANTVLPGRWYHMAIVIRDYLPATQYDPGSSKLDLYLNGQPVPMTKQGEGAVSWFGLRIAPMFDGMLDEFRTWDANRSQAQINEFMYRHYDPSQAIKPLEEFRMDEANASLKIHSAVPERPKEGTLYAPLHRLDKVWVKPSKLFATSDFLGQVLIEPNGKDSYEISFDETVDLSKVSGHLLGTWPGTVVEYNNAQITTASRFDFSNGKKLVFKLKKNGVFGKNYEQTVTLSAKRDKSNQCELLAAYIKQTKDGDVLASLIKPKQIDLFVTSVTPSDLSSMPLLFKISKHATAYVNGKEIHSGDKVSILEPLIITVKAENGRDTKEYILRLAITQIISVDPLKPAYTYGEQDIELGTVGIDAANATFAKWVSSDANIATVFTTSHGKTYLRVGRAGEAQISVHVLAHGNYAASNTVKFKVKVLPKEVKIVPLVAAVSNKPASISFDLDDLEERADRFELTELLEKGEYHIEKGSAQYECSDILPVGKGYVLAPRKATFETEKYKLQFQKSKKFDVALPEGMGEWIVTVKEKAKPKENILVTIGDMAKHTDAQGKASFIMPAAKYDYVVAPKGYALLRGTQDVKLGKQSETTLELVPATISLAYKTQGEGYIVGNLTQELAIGGNGDPVTAYSAEGFTFLHWLPGKLTDPTHTATNLQSAITYTAVFEGNPSPVTYSMAGQGGTLLVDGQEKTEHIANVRYGDPLPKVEAKVKDQNYYFVSWSDGSTDPVRNDKATGEAKYVAQFGKCADFPYSENFEKSATKLPVGWTAESFYPIPECNWKVTKEKVGPDDDSFLPLSNVAAIDTNPLDPERIAKGFQLDLGGYATLTTPKLRLSKNVQNIQATFKYRFQTDRYSSTRSHLLFQYQKKGKEWITLADLDPHDPFSMGEMQDFSKIFTLDLEANDKVLFRWVYQSPGYDYFAIVDDIYIGEPKGQTHLVQYIVDKSKATFEGAEKQLVLHGQNADIVSINPKPGYRLVEWKVVKGDAKYKQYTTIVNVHDVQGDVTLEAVFEEIYAKDVIFLIEDVRKNPIKDAKVTYAGKEITTGADGLAAFTVAKYKIPIGVHKLKVEHPGFQTVEKDQDADQYIPLNVTVTMPDLKVDEFLLTVKTLDDRFGYELADAKLTLTGGTMAAPIVENTKGNGIANINVPALGKYQLKIEKAGFVTLSDMAVEFTESGTVWKEFRLVSLVPQTYSVVFTVVNPENTPLKGATVTFNGVEQQTDQHGQTTFSNLESKTYDYSISMPTYNTRKGQCALTHDMALSVMLPMNHKLNVEVLDESKQAISEATVSLEETQKLASNDGKASFDTEDGEFLLRVEKPGYIGVAKMVTIKGKDETVQVTLAASKSFTFVVKTMQGTPIRDARIAIVGVAEYRTGMDGSVPFDLKDGDYNYSVQHDEFFPKTGSFNMPATASPLTIELQRRCKLSFSVASSKGPLADVRISVGDKELKTNTSGRGDIELPEGKYEYRIAHKGYLEIKETIELTEATKEIAVVLQPEPKKPVPPDAVAQSALAEAKVYPNPFGEYLLVASATRVAAYRLLSLEGRVVRHATTAGEHTLRIETQNVPQGVYVLQLVDRHGAQRAVRVVRM